MPQIFRRFPIKQPPVPLGEKWLAGGLAALAFILIGILPEVDTRLATPLWVASMGATAVLLFATPHSTLVQPWAILGGHLISATIGVASQQLIPHPFSPAVAVGLSIVAMYLTHSLHPPGGATALFAVIGGPSIWDLGYGYVLNPVAINAVLMLMLGICINTLFRPKTAYPARLTSASEQGEISLPTPSISPSDIRQALIDAGTYLDVTDDDLWLIYQSADLSAQKRFLSSHPISRLSLGKTETLRYGDSIEDLWQALKRSTNGCVVIVDAFRHIEGIITQNDVIPYLTQVQSKKRLSNRISELASKSSRLQHDMVAGQIMSTPVVTIHESASMEQVVAILADGHFHHVPVVDDRRRLLGVITHAHIWQALGK